MYLRYKKKAVLRWSQDVCTLFRNYTRQQPKLKRSFRILHAAKLIFNPRIQKSLLYRTARCFIQRTLHIVSVCTLCLCFRTLTLGSGLLWLIQLALQSSSLAFGRAPASMIIHQLLSPAAPSPEFLKGSESRSTDEGSLFTVFCNAT